MTAIVAANEQGKTLRLELIRYALFGTKALRGNADDYQGLNVELDFVVRDHQLKVIRNRKVLLYHGDELLASGTTPVNYRIIQEFGFGLKVFDVACSINQGEIEALSNMLPAERRAMVDQTIGLQFIDELARWCSEQARDARVKVEALSKVLVDPGPGPTKPDQAKFATETLIKKLERNLAEKHRIEGYLSVVPKKPEWTPRPSTRTNAVLKAHMDKRANTIQKIAENRKLASKLTVGRPETTEVTLINMKTKAEAWARYDQSQEFLRQHDGFFRNNQPRVTTEELDEMCETWKLIWQWNERQRLQGQLDRAIAEETIECPSCHYHWINDDSFVRATQQQIDELGPLPATAPDCPALSLAEIDGRRSWITLWEAVKDQWVEHPKPTGERPTWQRIQEVEKLVSDRAEKYRLLREAAELEEQLPEMEDVSEEWAAVQAYEVKVELYQSQYNDYFSWTKELENRKERLKELADVDVRLAAARENQQEWTFYNSTIKNWERAKELFDQTSADLVEASEAAEQWTAARTAMNSLRGKIKAYLVPSLNKVSSSLLNQMTNGVRNQILVDDQFDVLVDGQPLRTLSGSAKAVTNLAIRIGLGQVLTHRVFPVLMADEIDAAMDEERAEATAACIRNLSATLSQVLLVTHKSPEADHLLQI